MDIDDICEGFLQQIGEYGRVWILNHLRSEKGKAMNGRRVVVVGLDPPSTPRSNRRIHVKLLDPNHSHKPVGKILQIKPKNLIDPKNYCSATPEPTLTKEAAMNFLNQAYQNGLDQGHDKILPTDDDDVARDRPMRMKLIKTTYLSGTQQGDEKESSAPPAIECMDPLIPPDKQNTFEMIKSAITPACVGDGYVNFQRFAEGIVATGGMECAICQEAIRDDLIRLPCDHRFHLHCVKPWVEKENTCPTCRQELEHSLETYEFPDVANKIQNRFDEWFLSGMCERCQAVNMENDPVVNVTNESGTQVTMPLSAAKFHGYGDAKSVQGQAMEKINLRVGTF